jgi:hypothetical protein
MPLRFRCADDSGAEFTWATVAEVLDALEAGVLDPHAHIFDAARQCWQIAGAHPEVRAAWEERLRFQPPDAAGFTLPPLPELTPASAAAEGDGLDDLARRRLALALVREGRAAAAAALLLGEPVPPAPPGPARPAVPPVSAGLLAAAAVVLGLVAWGVTEVARGVAGVAAMRGSAPVAAQLTAAAPAEAVKR